MKVYVKKDKVLKLLGEGKVYSKKNLMLKEEDMNGDSNTITLTNDGEGSDSKTPANELGTDAAKELNTVNASGKNVQFNIQPNRVAGITPNNTITQNGTKSTPAVTVSQKDPRLNTLIQKNAQNGYATNVVKGLQTNSVLPKKVMDEMRANSVPFTKTELTEFLKSL